VLHHVAGLEQREEPPRCRARRHCVLARLDARVGARGARVRTQPERMAEHPASREDLVTSATSLFAAVRSGQVKIEVSRTYPLADAQQAHRDLESRKTTGSLLLLP